MERLDDNLTSSTLNHNLYGKESLKFVSKGSILSRWMFCKVLCPISKKIEGSADQLP